MKIAFVGKGGSGKSTLAALFLLYLLEEKQTVWAIDADLNIHLPTLLDIDVPNEKALSIPKNTNAIKRHLIGDSTYISDPNKMYKTTPPSRGSNLVRIQADDPILKSYSSAYKTGFLSIVGTYEKEEIGRSCYHTNLSILENILSFTDTTESEWLVADMVAGIDAFSNTLHMQFDTLCLVVEPTMESVSVYKQYMELGKHAHVHSQVAVVANKVQDAEDEAFLQTHIQPEHFIGTLPHSPDLKRVRREGKALTNTLLQTLDSTLFTDVANTCRNHYTHPDKRLPALHTLHRAYIEKASVKNTAGDLSGQIDTSFSYRQAMS